MTGSIEPEYHAAAANRAAGCSGGVAAEECRAVKIASPVTDDVSEGSEPIWAADELVDDGFFTKRVDLEDRSVPEIGAAEVVVATIACDAIEIALMVGVNQPSGKGPPSFPLKVWTTENSPA